MRIPHSVPARLLLAALAPSALALACGAGAGSTGGAVSAEAAEAVELATIMGELQRHSAKLGYAIAGRNRELAEFYLEEVEEALATVERIPAHDGMPIAHPASVILRPLLLPIESDLETADWLAAGAAYGALIEGCNRCHTATEHAFIEILPPAGPPPYNQRFAAEGGDGGETAGARGGPAPPPDDPPPLG